MFHVEHAFSNAVVRCRSGALTSRDPLSAEELTG